MTRKSRRISDNEANTAADVPLIESVSEDVAAEVGEFMEQAAQQNEAAAEAVPDVKNKPGPYISFEHVSKVVWRFCRAEGCELLRQSGGDPVHSGAKRRGEVGFAADADGLSEAGPGRGPGGREDIYGFTEQEMQHIRRKVTMVFQNGALFDSITVGENVAFPLRERGDLAEDQI